MNNCPSEDIHQHLFKPVCACLAGVKLGEVYASNLFKFLPFTAFLFFLSLYFLNTQLLVHLSSNRSTQQLITVTVRIYLK